MPTYCYEKPNGEIIERIMTISEMEEFDKKPVADGVALKRRVDIEMGDTLQSMTCGATPSFLTVQAATRHKSKRCKRLQPSKVCIPTTPRMGGQYSLADSIERNISEYLACTTEAVGMAMAEKKPKNPKIGKIMRTPGERKKFKVYVKDKGKVKIVRFGDPNMKIKKNIPGRRKNFRARHNCDNPGPKTKARYWACKTW